MNQSIHAHELVNKMKQESIHLIDIREPDEHQSGHVKGCHNIPMNELAYHPTNYLTKNETYYLICQSGVRSYALTDYLSNQGYQVIDVLGGHHVWPEDLTK